MNIVLLNTLENGGAASACKRLKDGLEAIGENTFWLTKAICEKEEAQHQNGPLQKALRYFRKRAFIKNNYKLLAHATLKPDYFSFPISPLFPEKHPMIAQAALINLHWGSDFIRYSSFFKNTAHIPMAITLHDMNYFTGGCHYSFQCEKFVAEQCDFCWQLEGADQRAAHKAFEVKRAAFANRQTTNTAIISPSLWLKNLSAKSELLARFPHFHVPNGIDTSLFKTTEKVKAREQLQLPLHGRIMLFIASEIELYRKGFQFVLELLPFLKASGTRLLVVGNSQHLSFEDESVINLGRIDKIEMLSWCYSAADAMLLPTLADNLPNTMLECLSCGTPVLGFRVGGLPDVIRDGENGYLCEPHVPEFQHIMQAFLQNGCSMSALEIKEEAVQKYDLKVQATAYRDIFRKLQLQPV